MTQRRIQELVSVETPDGLILSGHYYQSCADGGRTCVILIPGGGQSLHSANVLDDAAASLQANGVSAVVAGTRGRELLSWIPRSGGRRPVLGGFAMERIEEAPYDVGAWMDWVREAGYERVVVAGHSLGATKVLATLRDRKVRDPDGVVLIAPVDLTTTYAVVDPERQTHARARKAYLFDGEPDLMIRMPNDLMFSAKTFVELTSSGGPGDVAPLRLGRRIKALSRTDAHVLVVMAGADRYTSNGVERDAALLLESASRARTKQSLVFSDVNHSFVGEADGRASESFAWTLGAHIASWTHDVVQQTTVPSLERSLGGVGLGM